VRLDAESLEVLAAVAWNQPVARDRLVELGCDARPTTLRQLVRRGLLEMSRDGDDGEPAYRTTAKFLEVFKVQSLDDLPPPDAPPKSVQASRPDMKWRSSRQARRPDLLGVGQSGRKARPTPATLSPRRAARRW